MAERKSEYEEKLLEDIKTVVATEATLVTLEATLTAVQSLLDAGIKAKGSEGVVFKQTGDGKLQVSVS